jgi:retron-type reverse transcriptase
LHNELRTKTYKPLPLTTFVLRDPKTRVISKSDFRDRVVHHAIVNIIQPIFEKQFIHDSCANQVGKGTLFALERFQKYMQKVSHPVHQGGFCLKADIKQYFQAIDHEILLNILKRRITDSNVLWLIQQVLGNVSRERESRCAVCLSAT